MVFTVAVGVAKSINFSYTITLSTCPIYVGYRSTVLGFSFCITIKFLKALKSVIVMQELKAKTVGVKPT